MTRKRLPEEELLHIQGHSYCLTPNPAGNWKDEVGRRFYLCSVNYCRSDDTIETRWYVQYDGQTETDKQAVSVFDLEQLG